MCVCSHVATENELHQFSPNKEPLQSMLEGEIQAMYLYKPGRWMWGGVWFWEEEGVAIGVRL